MDIIKYLFTDAPSWFVALALLILICVIGYVVLYAVIKQKRGVTIWKIKIEPAHRNNNFDTSHLQPKVDKSVGTSVSIFNNSESGDFQKRIEELILEAKHIILIGTGLNIVKSNIIITKLKEKSKEGGCHIEIYLANPDSPEIERRLIEEELGPYFEDIKPPISYDGLKKRIRTLTSSEGYKLHDKYEVNLFNNYPTFALLIFDFHQYFVYPYGFAKLGNYSPVIAFDKTCEKHSDVIKFLNSHYERLKKNSSEALKTTKEYNQADIGSSLIPFCFYFTPAWNQNLYQYGKDVLGYDIYNNERQKTLFNKYIKTAGHFGFHVTICDVLYFLKEIEVEQIVKEIEYLLNFFHEFELTNLRITKSYPDKNSISILFDDLSGTLEALHHELVMRIYRKATASNYTLGIAECKRDENEQRNSLMIHRYKAPYVLNSFKPHFTLLDNIDAADIDNVYIKLLEMFKKYKCKDSIKVKQLFTLTKKTEDAYFVIRDKFICKHNKWEIE